jgi:hypothetical protein
MLDPILHKLIVADLSVVLFFADWSARHTELYSIGYCREELAKLVGRWMALAKLVGRRVAK